MTIRRTIAHLADHQQRRYGERSLFHHWRGGHWHPMSWRQARNRAQQVGAGLWELGCRHGDRVAVLSETRQEWCIVDLATLGFGAVVVGIYPTSTAEQVRYILEHSESRIVVVENEEQLAKIDRHRTALDRLETVVVIDPPKAEPKTAQNDDPRRRWISLDALAAQGGKLLAQDPSWVERCVDAVQPDHVATLVYTSGTTGPPKGVVLTHRSLFEIADITCRVMDLTDHDVSVVFLPLAHALQRVTVYAGLRAGACGYFAPSLEQLLDTWQAAQPTVMSSVPRVFEKIHNRIMTELSEQPRRRQLIFSAAMAVGRARSHCVQRKQRVPWHTAVAYRVCDRLVFSRIRTRIFGKRIRYLISGGAPISKDLLEFFHSMGVLILEGYGLTETSAPATLNRPGDYRFGTVGQALPDVGVRIAADGEVLIRGPGLFREYYKDAEATARAFDEEGWFRTGDIGELDELGFLRITDRKKDLIITAGGKNIAPQNIENLLKTDPHISQVMVHGDRRKHLVALITLDAEEMWTWARDHGKTDLSWSALVSDAAVQRLVGDIVTQTNRRLARVETIKSFRVLPEDFTVDNDMMTPTLKLKRRTIEQTYARLLDEMYDEPRPAG